MTTPLDILLLFIDVITPKIHLTEMNTPNTLLLFEYVITQEIHQIQMTKWSIIWGASNPKT